MLALQMIDEMTSSRTFDHFIVSGATYGSNEKFVAGLIERGLGFATEIRPSTRVQRLDAGNAGRRVKPVVARRLLRRAVWEEFNMTIPTATGPIPYHAADLGNVRVGRAVVARLIAAQIGAIAGLHRGTVFVLTGPSNSTLKEVLQSVGWARWIRPAVRRRERQEFRPPLEILKPNRGDSVSPASAIAVRSNIQVGRRQDESAAWDQLKLAQQPAKSRRVFASAKRVNVVELFAGAGGMGLGFLMAGEALPRYRMAFSGEANPIYAQTLKLNHDVLRAVRGKSDLTPDDVDAIDLRTPEARRQIIARAKECGGAHVLIGGPPCQGFSNANRNSWHGANPHNGLVNVFLQYVESLQPQVFLMENVQGILWTPQKRKSSEVSVVSDLARRFSAMGYTVFPKLLDAVWYGVPQHRTRFFLLGLRSDLGYGGDDFGHWGPFPMPSHGPGTDRPYVTVRNAIGDLPSTRNGEDRDVNPYRTPDPRLLARNEFLRLMRHGAPPRVIFDHVTSRHADYVIDRYRAIPPGKNWEAIADKLTNYTAVERTHSNIYRRLTWDEPSITIGHYRKSMLVHPRQHRGLSLREASRLQSFPDWFRFAGSTNGHGGGLVHKQQQLANAVCPLVTKAIAEFLLTL